jgi:3-hydroxypropanoate dehydrogenase
MADGNKGKVEAAPVSLLLAADPAFHEHMHRTFPMYPNARETLDPDAAGRESMARTSALLQAAYLIVALRAVGLAAGPMNGMDFAAADAEFFAETGFKSFLVINVGVADGVGTPHPRLPRLEWAEVTNTL